MNEEETEDYNTDQREAPYLIHWNANNIPVYYIMDWNKHFLDVDGHLNLIESPRSS